MRKIPAALAAFFVLACLAHGQGYPQNNAKRIWGLNISIPAAGDDGQFLRYNHATGYSWETAVTAEADTLATVTGRGATTDTAVGLNGGLSVDTPAFVVANATGAVSTTAMPTVAIAGGNAPTEALQITHTTPAVAAEMAATLAVSFDFVNSIDSGPGQEEAARLEVYKWGDWFNVPANDDDDDAGLKIYTTQDGDQTLRLTVGDGTSALNVAAINAAGGSATAVTINPTLGIMDGSDTWTGISVAPTNADHTGASNTVTGVSVGAITGDPDATETALSIGSGWDVGISSASDVVASNVRDTGSTWQVYGGLNLGSDRGIAWSSTSAYSGAKDTGLARASAGVVKVTDGSTGAGKLYVKQGASAAAPDIADATTNNNGIAFQNSTQFDLVTGGTARASIHTTYGVMASKLTFPAGTTPTVGLERATKTDTVKVTDGSTGSGSIQAKAFTMPLTADAVLQVGMIVMPDASADGRFDANTASEPTQMGVYAGTRASAQGTVYDVVVSGQAYVAPLEDVAVTRGHWLYQSATAGYANDTATFATADTLIIGQALYSEAIIEISTATAGTDVLVMASDPAWVVGEPVIYWDSGGTAITGLTDGTVYWVKTESTTSITLAATKGGATLDIGGDWSAADGPYLIRLPQAAINPR